MMKKNLSAGLLLVFCGVVSARAQGIPGTLNAAGGAAVVNNNVYEWSVAEMALVTTFSGSNIALTQGVLQPMEPTGTSVTDVNWFKQHFTLYPNPAQNRINLNCNIKQSGKLTLRITDVVGREMQRKQYDLQAGSTEVPVDISTLLTGNYLLEMFFNNAGSNYNTTYKFQKQD